VEVIGYGLFEVTATMFPLAWKACADQYKPVTVDSGGSCPRSPSNR